MLLSGTRLGTLPFLYASLPLLTIYIAQGTVLLQFTVRLRDSPDSIYGYK